VDPIEQVGTSAAFGAFLGALIAYARLRVEDAANWAMHGMVLGGIGGSLTLVVEAVS
jgi:hypothetical protein